MDTKILEEWKEKVGSPEKLIIAYLKTPSFSKAQIANIQSLFQLMVDYIVSQNMIVIKKNMTLEKIMYYVNTHLHENITIDEVSRYINKSVSSLSHLFTSLLKKSFKHYVIECKLKKAEELLLEHPEMTIVEIADQLGYDDPYYFSRLFKKYKGLPPSEYLKQSYIFYSQKDVFKEPLEKKLTF